MPSFTTRVENAWNRASQHLVLALVPAFTALLNIEKIEKVLRFDGMHTGFKFALPTSVVDLWQFTSVPNTGLTVSAGIPLTLPEALLIVPLGFVLTPILMAGYFGSLRDILTSETFDFAANARAYFWQFLFYELVPVVLLSPLLLAAIGGGPRALGPLFVIFLPAVLIGSYLFFATPYLMVLRETGLVLAAKRSYEFAIGGGAYLQFALGYAGFVVVASLLVTTVVVNLGAIGILLGTLGVAPLGLTLNLATMKFVADIDEMSPAIADTQNPSSRSAQ